MLGIFIVQLPFSVCAVWCLIVLFKRHKTVSDRLIMWVMGVYELILEANSFKLMQS